MDTIVVGVLDPNPVGDQQDGVGASGAQIAAGGEVRLLFGCQVLPAVGPDEQPRRTGARGGPFGVVGKRRDPAQR